MLTAIIPVDLKRRPNDIIKKSIFMSKMVQERNIKIVFGHNNRFTKYDYKIVKELQKYNNVKINSLTNRSDSINPSLLRNFAFDFVDTEYIILLDVDIYPDFELFEKYKNKIKENINPFYVIPCLYLTKYGSESLKKNRSIDSIKNKYFGFSRKEFLHLANPSSITILQSNAFKKINGFDESFNGHGYEDFDFLVRLYLHYVMLEKPIDFLLDVPSRSPLFVTGFRKYLGRHCLDILLDKDIAFHLYHEKDNNDAYYTKRKDNYNIFVKKHKHNISTKKYIDETLITLFISRCYERGLKIQDYSVYFENKPGHIDRFDTLKKRIKFLLH
ncbi:galactosyltransferase-related protein [Escherichia coli]|uniref:galactosyltransferase-related protein n=1 Tax=Escherichia coli TaxID=562 RepID=UPI001F331EB3|nr:galactosyltransferase-related protein [Escherichia coli]